MVLPKRHLTAIWCLIIAGKAGAMVISSRISIFAQSTSLRPWNHRRNLMSSSVWRRSPMLMMPEGPEVRTLVNQLQGAIGRRLTAIEFLSGRYSARNPPSGYEAFRQTMLAEDGEPSGKVVREWNCKGKFVYILLNDEAGLDIDRDDDFQRSIWITLGMTGRFVNEPTHQQQVRAASRTGNHARWCLVLVSPEGQTKRIYYYDQRSFGTLKFCLSKSELDAKLGSLGPDILQSTTTLADFVQILENTSPTANICKLLMNQTKLSGVGNYILAEALYRARIDPFASVQEVLATGHDGSTVAQQDEQCRSHRLFSAIQDVARESYASQQPGYDEDASFDMQCYGRMTCIRGNKVFQHTDGPHGRTIWYTEEQLFMPFRERLRQSGSADSVVDEEAALDDRSTSPVECDPVKQAELLLHGLTDPNWRDSLADATNTQSFYNLAAFLSEERRRGATVYPPEDEIYSALNLCPLDKVKVVIIGQDPYHGPGQGHGLAFSVKRGVPPPPSLKNIIREAMEDVGIPYPKHGNLEHWARQGVLLLNTVLTVRRGEANSHAKKGWEEFTDACIQRVNDRRSGVVFLLWGKPAAKKASVVDPKRHVVIKTSHPSPLGATKTASPFLGSRCFSRTNAALEQQGREPIDWSIR